MRLSDSDEALGVGDREYRESRPLEKTAMESSMVGLRGWGAGMRLSLWTGWRVARKVEEEKGSRRSRGSRHTVVTRTAELFWIPLVGSCFGGAGLAGYWH